MLDPATRAQDRGGSRRDSRRRATTSARRSRRNPTARCSSSCWRAPGTMSSTCTTTSYGPHNLPWREYSHVDRYHATDAPPLIAAVLVREHGSLRRRARRKRMFARRAADPQGWSRSIDIAGSVEVRAGTDRKSKSPARRTTSASACGSRARREDARSSRAGARCTAVSDRSPPRRARTGEEQRLDATLVER